MSLTTVDFCSFSSNYAPATITYDICICTAKGFRSGTSANVIITLVGEQGRTEPLYRPRGPTFASGGEHHFTIEDQNLGPLKSVIVAHDNSGLTPGWMVDKIAVVNRLTGTHYHFPCGQRLDSSTSQICISAQPLILDEVCKDVSEPVVLELHADLQDAHDRLGENFAAAINSIVKYFYPPSNHQTLEGQAMLLLGPSRLAEVKPRTPVDDEDLVNEAVVEGGLVGTITSIFLYGFKSKSRMFSGNRHIWDLFDRAHNNMKNSELSSDPEGLFFATVEKANSMNIHKTARLEWCICAGATHHVLHVWMQQLAQVAIASQWYDQTSPFKNPERVSFMTELLRYLIEFPFKIQNHLVYLPSEDREKVLGQWRVDELPLASHHLPIAAPPARPHPTDDSGLGLRRTKSTSSAIRERGRDVGPACEKKEPQPLEAAKGSAEKRQTEQSVGPQSQQQQQQ
jgi:hypothetical protein